MEELGLDPKTIHEVEKLQKIRDDLTSGTPVDARQLKNDLNNIINEMEQQASANKAIGEKQKELNEDIEKKEHDKELLQDLLDDLPSSGKTTPAQNEAIKNNVIDMINDITGNPDLDISTLTKEQLRDMGLSPEEIDEIMKLKEIYDQVNSGKPVDITKIKEELSDVIDLIDNDIKNEKAELNQLTENDDYSRKINEVDSLKNLEDKLKNIADSDMSVEDQNYLLGFELEQIMRDLAKDPNLVIASINVVDLRNMGLDENTIEEIMK